jgi:hypothetical protein
MLYQAECLGGIMKKAVLLLLPLMAGLSWAQQSVTPEPSPSGTIATTVTFPIERVQTPTTADLYCAGFIGKSIPKGKFVTGGLESPFATLYANGDAIYLNGKDYEAGQEYTIVRELTDPNRYELFKGQWAALKAAGQPYEELARVKVIDTRGKTAIAQVEFSCDTVVPGDLVVPFVEKQKTAFHPPLRFDRYVGPNGQVSGRIVLAKDFDSELGTGGKVYLNIGANQGLKVGDFLRAERLASTATHDPVDSLSAKSPSYEVTQSLRPVVDPTILNRGHGPVIHSSDMARRGVGEIVIVGTTPTTATGMIVFSLEPVHVGDSVELDLQQ